VRGAFRRFDHDHFFSQQGEITIMRDVFDFQSPLGIFGRIADYLVLTRYLRYFLTTRNATIKQAAETDEWQRYLQKT
jgi:ligand-binding SRPBCC domain-containing protein